MKEQATVQHNQNRKKDGRPMGPSGQRGSFLASLGNHAKGHGQKETAPVNENRTGSWMHASAGGNTFMSVTPIGTDTYSVSWIRPEGRTNSYSDKGGKNEIRRSVSVRTTTDLVDHVTNITDRPTTIVVDILGPKVVFPKG